MPIATVHGLRRRLMAVALVVALTASLLTLAGSALVGARAATSGGGVLGGWFGYWTSSSTVAAQAREGAGALSEPMIFMWRWAGWGNPACTINPANGGCTSGSTTTRYDESRKALQAKGMEVYGSHTDLDYRDRLELTGYLASSANRQKMADLLTTRAVRSRVDGVDLDWENFAFNDGSSTWSATKGRFVDTIKRLSKALHAKGKKLSVTVPGGYAPYSGGSPNPGGGYWVYAWKEIGPYVDKLRLMAYDYSHSSPLGIGPNDWATEVARSAKAQVGASNARKVWIGAPQYGRYWVRKSGSSYVTRNCPSNWAPSSRTGSLGLSSVRSIQRREGVSGSWNSSKGEWSFRYWQPASGYYYSGGSRVSRTCDAQYEVWYADQRSVQERLKIVKNLGIGGVAVWHLGGLESNFYSAGVADLAKSLGGPLVEASVVAPDRGMHGSLAMVQANIKKDGKALANSRVVVRFNPTGSSGYKIGSYLTDQSGNLTVRIPVTRSGSVEVRNPAGTSSRFRDSVYIRAHRLVEAQTHQTTVPAGSKAQILGRITPGVRGLTVRLQEDTGQGFRTIKTSTTRSRGQFGFTVPTSTTPATRLMRVLVVGTATHGSGSDVITLQTTASRPAENRGVGLQVSAPDDVVVGSAVVVRSRVTRDGRPVVGEPVGLKFVPRVAGQDAIWLGFRRTNKRGVVRHFALPPVTGDLIVRSHSSSSVKFREERRIVVRSKVTAAVTPENPAAGGSVRMQGQVTPRMSGLTVRRQLLQDGQWVTKSKATTDGQGSFSFDVNLYSSPTSYRYRFQVTGNDRFGNGTSHEVRFRAD